MSRLALRTSPLLTLCRPCVSHARRLPQSRFRYLSTATVDSVADSAPIFADLQKSQKRALKDRHKGAHPSSSFSEGDWEVTCGLEVHTQLNTKTKLFSSAKTSITDAPNTCISFIDAALPGTQPKLNPAILLPALRAVFALECIPAKISRFDRKHYFYWDQPAGYQITQFYEPLAKNGRLVLTPDADGVDKRLELKIRQIQIEQDTGKTIAAPPNSLVDLNRVGSPLIEIITDPFPLDSAETAGKVLAKIQAVLRAVDACVIGMEWGGLRADVNVSVRRRGDPNTPLGQRCEIKNLSSFKAVTDAITSEAARQIEILEAGGTVEGETRGWDNEKSTTRRLRGKEGEVDYRYMPEPDLPPICLTSEVLEAVKKDMPLLPDQIIAQLTDVFGLTAKDARTLLLWDEGRSGSPDSVISYYKDVVGLIKSAPGVGKIVGNWVIHELGGLITTHGLSWQNNPVEKTRLADLVSLIVNGKITNPTAKTLLPRLFTDKRMPVEIVEAENLGIKEMSGNELETIIKEVLDTDRGRDVLKQLVEMKGDDSKAAEKKKKGLRGFVLGGVMRSQGGKVKADQVESALDSLLEKL
ncbi:GatB/GatE catalytic domain-containing protein [Pyronema omphalodes]|nr:GatB/GatE catalytic domain-containing protein [Pyronema omphalodes]